MPETLHFSANDAQRALGRPLSGAAVVVWVMPQPTDTPFTTAERALLRFEFLVRFGQAPRLADGMWLRTWRGGPQAGQPKVSPAVRSMLERGLVTIEIAPPGARAYFTDAGLAVARQSG